MTEDIPDRDAGSAAGEAFARALPPDMLDALVKDAYANGGRWARKNY
ncbi:hypothetical protein [Amycolatopsis sp. NPDC051071]